MLEHIAQRPDRACGHCIADKFIGYESGGREQRPQQDFQCNQTDHEDQRSRSHDRRERGDEIDKSIEARHSSSVAMRKQADNPALSQAAPSEEKQKTAIKPVPAERWAAGVCGGISQSSPECQDWHDACYLLL